MNEYKDFTDSEIVKAVELMVCKDDLTIREVEEALLNSLSYNKDDIAYYLATGEYLNDDSVLAGAVAM